MLNYLWGFMLLIGIVYAAVTGNLPAITKAALDSAKEAVTLCITMIGVMSFWMGLMRIAENAGIIAGATRKLKPFLRPSAGTQGQRIHSNQYDRQHIRAGLGSDSCGIEGDGGFVGAGGRAAAGGWHRYNKTNNWQS